MPVDEDSDKSKFGKLSDGSKLSEMIKSVGKGGKYFTLYVYIINYYSV